MKKELGKLTERDLDVVYLKTNPRPSSTPKQLMVVNEISLVTNIIRSNSMTWFILYTGNMLRTRTSDEFY